MQSVKKSNKKAVVIFTVFAFPQIAFPHIAFPHIAETSDPFEQSNKLSVKIWKIFCSNCIFKEQGFLNSLLRPCTQNTNVCECRGFLCSACRFAAIHILTF